MQKIKKIKHLKRGALFIVVAGLLSGMPGCLEKEGMPQSVSTSHPNNHFGLYKIHLTLIDVDTKDPLSDLHVKLSNNTSFQMSSPSEAQQVTDSIGMVHITIAAAPPIPQEFLFSISDTTRTRLFQQTTISIRFVDPVFKYIPTDALIWGKLYQGTTELTLLREIKQIYYYHE